MPDPCRFCDGKGCISCEGTGVARMPGQHFDGATYDPTRDQVRLSGALQRVRDVMTDQNWHTLRELAAAAKCSEAAVSARVRDLRKARFGAYQIDRKYWDRGVWKYRMVLEE